MSQPPIEELSKMRLEQEGPREKICISISEGCIRHYNEEPEIEEQFILRLPEKEAKVVNEALETDSLEKRMTICVEKNQRDATVTLDGKQMIGKIMDLPTIIESHKLADESTLYKTADISQILVCDSSEERDFNIQASSENEKKVHASILNKGNEHKYSNGLCPPLKNARKKRFRKVQLEENFDPDVDRAVKLLLRADGAAESVRFEIAYEDLRDNKDEARTDTDENLSAVDDSSSILSASNEVDVFGETLSLSSYDDDSTDLYNNDSFLTNFRQSDHDSDFDSDIGNIENYDLDTLTEEQKHHLAQLKEIDWCLSNFDYKISPPRLVARGTRGRGRGRGRPRVHNKSPKPESDKPRTHISMAGRGGRGRPPGRGRGRTYKRSTTNGRPRGSSRGHAAMVCVENDVL